MVFKFRGQRKRDEFYVPPDWTRIAIAGLCIILFTTAIYWLYQDGSPNAIKDDNTATLAPSKGLQIRSATYGGNCGAAPGNATTHLARSCHDKLDCTYVVDVERLSDPVPRCSKDFVVEYSCPGDATPLHMQLPAEAGLKSELRLSCASPQVIANLKGLQIRTATYGGNCGVPPGNATKQLAVRCDGKADCSYVVDVERLGDPAPRCGKDFVVEYTCSGDATPLRTQLPAEAGLKSELQLSCTSAEPIPANSKGLQVRSATYGGNCGVPPGNATKHLAGQCNGKVDCSYVVDVEQLRDPAPRCSKDFVVEYTCPGDATLLRMQLPGEAGLRSRLQLSCKSGPR